MRKNIANRVMAFVLVFLIVAGNIPATQVKGLSVNADHSAVILPNGTLWSWGLNSSGQLGDGTDTYRDKFVQEASGNNTWSMVSTGAGHTMAIKNDGSLWAWGNSDHGQLGIMSTDAPTRVGTDTWKAVSAGANHTVAIRSDGTLWAWGLNTNGQLGDGFTATRFSPFQISSDTDWEVVSAGTSHTVAIKGGELWAWGNNANGRLGNGQTTGDTLTPFRINTLYNPPTHPDKWISVSAGDSHTFAILSSSGITDRGGLWAWGSNADGRLGNGQTSGNTTTPFKIGPHNGWQSVSAGLTSTMAIRSDETLWGWGSNSNGRLGNGQTTNSTNTPVQIGEDDNWNSVTVWGGHTVAKKTDNSIWAWGNNTNGRLADGTTTQRNSPELIYVQSIEIDVLTGDAAVANSITRAVGDTVKVGITGQGIYDLDVSSGLITWTSSNPSVVPVPNASGEFTILGSSGTPITLTATARNRNISATLTIDVALSIDGNLSELTVNEGTLTPVFDTGVLSYTLDVEYAVDELEISAKAHALAASVIFLASSGTVTTTVSSGVHNATVSGLPVGTTTITIDVTAQNTAYVKTYTIVVTRAAPEIKFNTDTVAISNSNLTATVDASGSTAPGPYTLSTSTPFPSEITPTINQTTKIITITAVRPSVAPVTNGAYTVSVVCDTTGETKNITVNVTNLTPPFILSAASVTIDDLNTAAEITVLGDSDLGEITLDHDMPAGFLAEVNQTTGVITITATRHATNALDATFPITVSRANAAASTSFNVVVDNLSPEASPSLSVTETSVDIDRDTTPTAFIASVNVEGTATGKITLSPASLPGIAIDINQLTGEIIFTGTPNASASATSYIVTVQRQGLNATLTLNVNLQPPPADPTIAVSQANIAINDTTPTAIILITGTAIGDISVNSSVSPSGVVIPGVEYKIIDDTVVVYGTRPTSGGNIGAAGYSVPITIMREGASTVVNVSINLTTITTTPTLTASPESLSIIDSTPNLTTASVLGGTASGFITLDDSDLPAGFTATVDQVTRRISITGVRPDWDAAEDTVGSFELIATRQGISTKILIGVNLTRPGEPPNLILTPATVDIDITNPTVEVEVGGTATGNLNITPGSSLFVVAQEPGIIRILGVRPGVGQAPVDTSVTLTVTRQGVTQNLTVNVKFPILTSGPNVVFSSGDTPLVIDNPASLSAASTISLSDTNTAATGPISLNTVGLPTGFSATVNQVTGVITVTGAARTGNLPAIDGTFPIIVSRQGATSTLNVTIKLPAVGAALVIDPEIIEITTENLSDTVEVEGYATGDIDITVTPELPPEVTWSVEDSTITVTGTRPPFGAEPIDETFTFEVTRGGESKTFTVVVDIEPGNPPTFTLSPNEITLDDDNFSRTVTVGGNAAGDITFNTASGEWPDWLKVTLPVHPSSTMIISGIPPILGEEAIDETVEIIFIRGGISTKLTVIADMNPIAPTLTLTPSTIIITDNRLTADVDVTGNAIGNITLNLDALPSGLTATVDQETGIITVTATPTAGGTDIDGTYEVIVSRHGLSAILTINVSLKSPAAFTPVTNITLSTTYGQMNTPFNFNEYASLVPHREGNATPKLDDVVWEVLSTTPIGNGTISANIRGSVLTASGDGQGTVRVKATIPNGTADGVDYTQEFTLTFSIMAITASIEGIGDLYTGRNVSARVVFTLEGGVYANEITPSDFFVQGLPNGMVAEAAERVDVTTVAIRITGAPTSAITSSIVITVPKTINERNMRNALLPAAVSPNSFTIGEVTTSAGVSPSSVTFDLNPLGSQHRDISVSLNTQSFRLRDIYYGMAVLKEDTDYTVNLNNSFTFHKSFLSKLPVGQWEITFRMNYGASPTVTVNVIDSSRSTGEDTPEIPTGPPPVPPMTPMQPDENFMYLSGGTSVNLNNLRWDLNRARVNPVLQNGIATVTVRTHVLDHLSLNVPDATVEVVTSAARVRIPTDLLDVVYGARAAIVDQELEYDEVNLKISITNRSKDENLNYMFEYIYPNGEMLTPIIELRIELIDIKADEVFFTAYEFTRPITTSFVVMNNAGHLRPAGVLFARAWLEFVPHHAPSPNEFLVNTIFPGTFGMMHNRVHFEDIELAHWGFINSYTAAYSGLVAPVENLNPSTPITRGEFAQLVAFALQLPRANANISGFVDVLPSNIYFDSVSRLFAAGLLGELVPNARFHPNSVITREEIAAIAGMALLLNEPVRQSTDRPLQLAFLDYTDINANHFPYVQATVDYGVMGGLPDKLFAPRSPATRLHALLTVMNLAKALGVIDEE